MEIIDLGLSDLEPISIQLNENDGYASSSLGGGIELLMNDKKKATTGSTNIDLGELDRLEDELNNLSSVTSSASEGTKSVNGLGSTFSNFFGLSGGNTESSEKSQAHARMKSESNLGSATYESMGNTQTWDGFKKINEVPQEQPASKLSDREKRRKKRLMIKKIEEWYEKGLIKNNPHFTMDSVYEEVEDEYETALEDKRKKDSVKLQGWWFMTAVNSIEYANSAFDPFGINLDGWGEQVSEDIESYEEIFSELHDKYKGGKLAPEVSLLLRLGFSAAVVNFSNKALSSATPAFNDVIKQSPELMRMFTNATVSSMSQASPGFAMANNLMRDSTGPSKNMGPPPAPVETKYMPNIGQRPGNNTGVPVPANRPDISLGRGASLVPPMNARQEMRGPSTDIDSILSGLKTKTVDIHSAPPASVPLEEKSYENTDNKSDYGMDSMISVTSLNEMQGATLPKRSRRRNGSRGNTVSLDI
jgi:hypothetical protein|uniref:Uncharacterized protein n=1 Tax=viral metagenome TaxID=1070528 RepID=A0A6C0E1E8_9ZZZZ